ncbi:hypothetical protein Ahia01_001308700 [Argonauta hians]
MLGNQTDIGQIKRLMAYPMRHNPKLCNTEYLAELSDQMKFLNSLFLLIKPKATINKMLSHIKTKDEPTKQELLQFLRNGEPSFEGRNPADF